MSILLKKQEKSSPVVGHAYVRASSAGAQRRALPGPFYFKLDFSDVQFGEFYKRQDCRYPGTGNIHPCC